MKKLFIVANWKSNKTIKETEEWLHDFSDEIKVSKTSLTNKVIIIAPPFTSLEHAHYCSENLKLSIRFAAQTISPFEEGAYTGEINGKQIKELADYVIVGHSERRKYFYEDSKMVEKISICAKYGITPILCISDIKQIHDSQFMIHNSKFIVAYEPLSAIGSGYPDAPENADEMARSIKKELGEVPVLYGGSVTSKNVLSFTKMENIDGVLVGGASLDAKEFARIAENA